MRRSTPCKPVTGDESPTSVYFRIVRKDGTVRMGRREFILNYMGGETGGVVSYGGHC